MRAVWGILVAVGAIVVVVGIAGSMASDYVDRYGTLIGDAGQGLNVATATLERMRSLIGHLRVR
jgi:hypothetical protein